MHFKWILLFYHNTNSVDYKEPVHNKIEIKWKILLSVDKELCASIDRGLKLDNKRLLCKLLDYIRK